MANPYDALPESAFWRSAVAQRHFSEVGPLWSPSFEIQPEHKVVTFGSCFAQHIGVALSRRGFGWHSTELPPPALSATEAWRFNYNVFSCRTANIYTTSLLLQWVRWALGTEPAPSVSWEQEGRHFDPFRPTIEPGGFESAEEVVRLRETTIAALATAIRSADCFMFTMGLTESWRDERHGFEYQMCPGTVCGTFDAEQHRFHNLGVFEVTENLRDAIALMRTANEKLRFVLTVSPVPLTATRSGQHVLVATTESKSILRAAAAQIRRELPYVDYFPSYEIITSPVTRGVFFEPNQRQISQSGVDFVMDHFFACLRQSFGTPVAVEPRPLDGSQTSAPSKASVYDVACEEELLAAFGPR